MGGGGEIVTGQLGNVTITKKIHNKHISNVKSLTEYVCDVRAVYPVTLAWEVVVGSGPRGPQA